MSAATVVVSLRLESLTDGIVVDGQLRAPWADSCRRCLAPAHGEVISEVHELYQQVITVPDAFEIIGDQLDLVPMIRENLLLDAPIAPLCRQDCAGLCPTCGIDRNPASLRLPRHGGRSSVGCVDPAQGNSARPVAATAMGPANLS